VKRWIGVLLLMVLLLSVTGVSYATSKDGQDRALQRRLANVVARNHDYEKVAHQLRDMGMTPNLANVATEYAGQSPDGNPIYTVAIGVEGEPEGTEKAILALVEGSKPGKAKVHRVVLIGFSRDDVGYQKLEVTVPGRDTVYVKYDPATGEVIETTGPLSVNGQCRAVGNDEPTFSTQGFDVCDAICWTSSFVACSSVCVPLGMVTTPIGSLTCDAVCGFAFAVVCSYCP